MESLERAFDSLLDRISTLYSTALEKLGEQSWFQELKGKYDELDPQSRLYLKGGAIVGSGLTVFVLVLSFILSVHGLKNELRDKTELLTIIQGANDELHALRDTNQRFTSPAASGPWPAYFEATAGGAGIDKASLTVGAEKPVDSGPSGASGISGAYKESNFDLSVKHVSIKNVVRFAYALETGAKPAKLKNLAIDTHADPAGYMDAELSVTAYTVTASK